MADNYQQYLPERSLQLILHLQEKTTEERKKFLQDQIMYGELSYPYFEQIAQVTSLQSTISQVFWSCRQREMLATFNMTMLAGQIRARCLGEEACYVDAPLTEAGKQLNDYILRARELTEMFEIRYISFQDISVINTNILQKQNTSAKEAHRQMTESSDELNFFKIIQAGQVCKGNKQQNFRKDVPIILRRSGLYNSIEEIRQFLSDRLPAGTQYRIAASTDFQNWCIQFKKDCLNINLLQEINKNSQEVQSKLIQQLSVASQTMRKTNDELFQAYRQHSIAIEKIFSQVRHATLQGIAVASEVLSTVKYSIIYFNKNKNNKFWFNEEALYSNIRDVQDSVTLHKLRPLQPKIPCIALLYRYLETNGIKSKDINDPIKPSEQFLMTEKDQEVLNVKNQPANKLLHSIVVALIIAKNIMGIPDSSKFVTQIAYLGLQVSKQGEYWYNILMKFCVDLKAELKKPTEGQVDERYHGWCMFRPEFKEDGWTKNEIERQLKEILSTAKNVDKVREDAIKLKNAVIDEAIKLRSVQMDEENV